MSGLSRDTAPSEGVLIVTGRGAVVTARTGSHARIWSGQVCVVRIEKLNYNWLSSTIANLVKRRRISHRHVVPLSVSVLSASVLPVSVRPESPSNHQGGSVVQISPQGGGVPSNPGYFNCYDPARARAYAVPHPSQLTLRGSKGPTKK